MQFRGLKITTLISLFVIATALADKADVAPSAVPEIRPGILTGYLSPKLLPDSLAILPPEPALDSPELLLDLSKAEQFVALHDTPRWQQAALDADLSFPFAAGTFSCAINAPITEEYTPYLYQLLRRTLTDAGLSTYAAKQHYQRSRPFMVNQQPICTPEKRESLEKDGSYPSGHSAVGWAWALLLTEISPDDANAILARGIVFGESRNICNLHWHQDVLQGRVMGAATVARLHADPQFASDLAKAKKELAAVKAQNMEPIRDCEAERAALAK